MSSLSRQPLFDLILGIVAGICVWGGFALLGVVLALVLWGWK